MSIERYQQLTRLWQQAGRSPERLLQHPESLMALRCWVGKHGGGGAVAEFSRASVAAMDRQAPGWYDQLLAQRRTCSRCGQTWRVENLQVCTSCGSLVCAYCAPPSTLISQPHCMDGELVG